MSDGSHPHAQPPVPHVPADPADAPLSQQQQAAQEVTQGLADDARSVPTLVTNHRRKIHAQKPSAFDGKDWEQWFHTVRLYMRAAKEDFDTDEARILFVLSFLTTGTAGEWAQNWLDCMDVPPKQDWTLEDYVNYNSFQDFVQQATIAFANKNRCQDALLRLQNLKQEDRPAEEFFTEFEQLKRTAEISTLDNGYLLSLLERNLRRSIVWKIMSQPEMKETYKAWKKTAIHLDSLERCMKAVDKANDFKPKSNKPNNRGNPPPPIPSVPPQQQASTSPPVTRQDGTGTTFGGRGQPMQLDCAKLMLERRCFYCKEQGHMKAECPKLAAKPMMSRAHYARSQVALLSAEERAALVQELSGSGTQQAESGKEDGQV